MGLETELKKPVKKTYLSETPKKAYKEIIRTLSEYYSPLLSERGREFSFYNNIPPNIIKKGQGIKSEVWSAYVEEEVTNVEACFKCTKEYKSEFPEELGYKVMDINIIYEGATFDSKSEGESKLVQNFLIYFNPARQQYKDKTLEHKTGFLNYIRK